MMCPARTICYLFFCGIIDVENVVAIGNDYLQLNTLLLYKIQNITQLMLFKFYTSSDHNHTFTHTRANTCAMFLFRVLWFRIKMMFEKQKQNNKRTEAT